MRPGPLALLACLAPVFILGCSSSGLFYHGIEGYTSPLPFELRQPAAFEPVEAVMVRWDADQELGRGIPTEVIAELTADLDVVTLVDGGEHEQEARAAYEAGGVDPGRCTFLHAPEETDVSELREYGPWFAFDDDGMLRVVDYTFDFAASEGVDGAAESRIPVAYANQEGIGVITIPLATQGRNHISDGMGLTAAGEALLPANPGMSGEDVAVVFREYIGVENTDVVPDSLGVDHITQAVRFVRPDEVVVVRVPVGDPRYEDFEAMVAHFASRTSSYGAPYVVHRLDAQHEAPYLDALIAGRKVLVPTIGEIAQARDPQRWGALDVVTLDEMNTGAIEAWQAAMPAYEVIPFDGPWTGDGAMFARTVGIPDRGMLAIRHTPIRAGEAGADGIPIEAELLTHSGQPLVPDALSVRWRTASDEWERVPMEAGTEAGEYVGTIPAQDAGTVVEYYIHAADESGRAETHPLIGADDAHVFLVE